VFICNFCVIILSVFSLQKVEFLKKSLLCDMGFNDALYLNCFSAAILPSHFATDLVPIKCFSSFLSSL